MCNRPFENINEMNEALITNWNALVSKVDEIYILGDFLYKDSGIHANEFLKRLKGKKYLIKGNHEKYLTSGNFDASAFEWVKDYHVLNYKDARFILFHYPILEWQHYFKKSAHLYGHIHNNESNARKVYANLESPERAINVGVDVNNYYPVNAETIYARAFITGV
jgi:calcineurin-like phosphoesterase family protein